jgi:peroxiredoxin
LLRAVGKWFRPPAVILQIDRRALPVLDSRAIAPNVASEPNPLDERMPTMTIQTGDKLPDATFVKVTENGPEQVNTADYFKGRKVALFSVPGAFTPTCSAKHLPGFVDKADELKAKGVDEIVCTAVNDAFVMGAWGKSGNAGDSVTMLADGNGAFAEAVGLTMDGTAFGMGKRGQRFSMIVNDGVVEQLNVEAPGEFKVSSADHMLEQL